MTFHTDDHITIAFVKQTQNWVLVLNGLGVKDAKREKTLKDFVAKNSVPWERPFND